MKIVILICSEFSSDSFSNSLPHNYLLFERRITMNDTDFLFELEPEQLYQHQ